jgi:hypothetical protein
MNWIAESGKEYQLCLIDTNVISEISKNTLGERNKFINKMLLDSWMICITTGSLFEIRRKTEVYEKFLEIFSILPFFIIKPFINLFEEEKRVYGINENVSPIELSISFANKDQKFHLKRFMNEIFSRLEVIRSEKMRRSDEISVINNWISRKNIFDPELNTANSKDADRYVKEALIQTVMNIDINLGSNFIREKIENYEEIRFEEFKSVAMMLFSQYYRLYDPGWKSAPQEVTDVEIMAPVPYVDVVITENYQAEILRKVKNNYSPINNLEILTLRNIRSWPL